MTKINNNCCHTADEDKGKIHSKYDSCFGLVIPNHPSS